MSRHWPEATKLEEAFPPLEEELDVLMPPVEEQDRMIELYFQFVYPEFPILHEQSFRRQYEAWCALLY